MRILGSVRSRALFSLQFRSVIEQEGWLLWRLLQRSNKIRLLLPSVRGLISSLNYCEKTNNKRGRGSKQTYKQQTHKRVIIIRPLITATTDALLRICARLAALSGGFLQMNHKPEKRRKRKKKTRCSLVNHLQYL